MTNRATRGAVKEERSTLKGLHEEAGGLTRTFIIEADVLPLALAAAKEGDRDADRVFSWISQFLEDVVAIPYPPSLCLCCGIEMRDPHNIKAFVLTTAFCDEPSIALVRPFCSACAALPQEQRGAAILKDNEELWPDGGPVIDTSRISTTGNA